MQTLSNTESDFVSLGDVCRSRLAMQCQYGSRYANPAFSSDSAKEAGRFYPFCAEGLRITGNFDNYHSLEIHCDDVETFVQRVQAHST